MEHGPSAFAAHSAGGCDESGGVGREEWGGAGYDLEARDGAEGGVSIHDPQARCRSRSKATDADRWRRVSGRVAPRGTVRDEAFGEDRTRKEDRVLERCACRDGSRTAHIRTAATGISENRKLSCCFRLTLRRDPGSRRPPGQPPPIALRHLRCGVSSRLRSRRTTCLVSPGPGTEHRGMHTGLRGPAATAHYLTCGRWSHSRNLRRAPGRVQELGGSGMGEQGMAVGLGTWPLVLPGLAAVGAPHHPAKLYAGYDEVWV